MESNTENKKTNIIHIGRPSIYTKQIRDEICNRLALGESIRHITKDKHMPSSATIFNWLLDADKRPFLEQYATARNIQAENMFEELNELADLSVHDIRGDDKSDNARVQARKLQVDTRKWFLSKVLPKKFGDKLDLTSDNKPLPLLHALRNNNRSRKNLKSQEEN
jgi:hypothetical protein